MDKFLKKDNLPKLTQETEHVHNSMFIKEIDIITTNLSHKQCKSHLKPKSWKLRLNSEKEQAMWCSGLQSAGGKNSKNRGTNVRTS